MIINNLKYLVIVAITGIVSCKITNVPENFYREILKLHKIELELPTYLIKNKEGYYTHFDESAYEYWYTNPEDSLLWFVVGIEKDIKEQINYRELLENEVEKQNVSNINTKWLKKYITQIRNKKFVIIEYKIDEINHLYYAFIAFTFYHQDLVYFTFSYKGKEAKYKKYKIDANKIIKSIKFSR